MADNILWLAAYPKTGSTWVRAILQQMLAPKVRPKDAFPSFANEYPSDAPTYLVRGVETKILRTHCHPQHRSIKALIEQRSHHVVGVITVQRHPLDVLLSQLNYAFTLGREASFKNGIVKGVEEIIADGEIDHYIDAFIANDGCPEFARRCLSYPGFYSAWTQFASDADHLNLRYEDMVADREAAVQMLARFIHLQGVDAEKIAAKVEQKTQVNGRFYWRKRAYNYREMLPEPSIWRFESRYGPTLRELGYCD